MNFIIDTQTEVIKTKRTASFWLSVMAAGFIPTLLFLGYFFEPEVSKELSAAPWQRHFFIGWQPLMLLFPMYIILICTLIPHIEYRNNTWKQVFAAPRSIANIYFSKFLTIHLMIFFFYLLFNVFMILTGVFTGLINSKFTFLEHSIDWMHMLKLNFKTYISILGISSIMYWIALRFKNFIIPLGIGLALLIGSIIAINFKWEHVAKIPFAHPFLTIDNMKPGRPILENHEWNSIGFCVFFLLVGFLDMKLRKEKG